MPIHIRWDDDERMTLCMTTLGPWTRQDCMEALQQAHRLMDDALHDFVDVIIDIRGSPMVPSNVLSHLSALPRVRHPRAGLIVLVGVDAFARTLFAAMTHLDPQGMRRVAFVATIDEARALLLERQHAIGPDPGKANVRDM